MQLLTEKISYLRVRKGLAATLRPPPRPLRIEPVVERLDLLPSLRRRELSRVRSLEEARRQLDEPLRLDGHHVAHIFFRGQYEFMVH